MKETDKLGKEYMAMVGFIDLLGFGAKSRAVETHGQLNELREQVAFVHETFQTNRKEKYPDFHFASRQEILTFSDCIVVSVAESSKMTEQMGVFERFLFEVFSWGLSQLTCMQQGVFLRGGVSFGPWFYQDNILISPAHTKAYYLETNSAKHPVICFDCELYDKLQSLLEKRGDSSSFDMLTGLFRKYSPDGKQEFHHIDYLKIGLSTSTQMIPPSPEFDSEIGRKLRQSAISQIKKQIFFKHREAVIKGCLAAPEKARDKFIFLMKYHNELVDSYRGEFQECRIPIPGER